MRQTRIAKLFMNGRSQAVRLPAEFRFEGEEVFVYKDGDNVVLTQRPTSWDGFFDAIDRPTADFMLERLQPGLQQRDSF
jgi:antitoxin VapB